MTTAKAVSELRESMGVTQRDFAEKLGTTIETVSRWENGRREPTREAIEKLATLAHSAGIRHLRNFFLSQEVAGIVSRVKGLKTPGSERQRAGGDGRRLSVPEDPCEDSQHCHVAHGSQ